MFIIENRLSGLLGMCASLMCIVYIAIHMTYIYLNVTVTVFSFQYSVKNRFYSSKNASRLDRIFPIKRLNLDAKTFFKPLLLTRQSFPYRNNVMVSFCRQSAGMGQIREKNGKPRWNNLFGSNKLQMIAFLRARK